jgi:hypothetical protein
VSAGRSGLRADRRRTAVFNTEEVVKSLIWWPGFHRIADALPDQGADGRPRDFPKAMVLLYGCLSVLKGSHAMVEAELDETSLWALVQREWSLYEWIYVPDPDQRHVFEPGKTLRWHHWKYARDRYLATDFLNVFLERFTDVAVDLTLELGFFNPTRGSLSRPHRTQSIYGDGTEVRSLYRSRVEKLEMPNGETVLVVVDPKAKNKIRAILATDEETGKTQAIDPGTGALMARPPVDVDAFGTGKVRRRRRLPAQSEHRLVPRPRRGRPLQSDPHPGHGRLAEHRS